MRRAHVAILPAFLLALLLQVLAPIGATFAMAAAANDPGAFPICSDHISADGTHQPSPNGAANDLDACCTLCGLAHMAAPPVEPPTPTAVLLAPTTPAAYPAVTDHRSTPRAPPRSGLSRAPPTRA